MVLLSFRKAIMVLGMASVSAAGIILLSEAGVISALRQDARIRAEARREWRDGDPGRRQRALALFREALVRDAASPYRWCDLAEALAESGDAGAARSCFARAEELGSNIPPILMRISNFHLMSGEERQSLRYTARALALAPDYDSVIFSRYRALNLGIDSVLRDGIPVQRRAAQSYFRALLADGPVSDAKQCWNWILQHGLSDDGLAGEYVASLLKKRLFEPAGSVWAEYLGPRRGDYLRTERLYNGGFEFEPAASPLDWSWEQAPGVEVAREAGRTQSGKYSLRIGFNGCCNTHFEGPRQSVLVEAGWFELRAMASSESLTTDSGVCLRVFDPESPARLDVATEQLLGSNGWTRLAREFRVPSGMHLVRIQVVRRASSRVDNRIGGTVWIDDVSVSKVSAPGQTH